MAALPDAGKISDAFSTSSRALAVASEEFGRIVNLPAFDQGQRIFEVLERLERKIDRSIERTDTLRTDMNNRFDGLELRLRAELVVHPTPQFYDTKFIVLVIKWLDSTILISPIERHNYVHYMTNVIWR